MPFTPFHLGPALLIGAAARKRVHILTLLVSSVIIDLEPLAVLIFGIGGVLHGYTHTFLFAIVGGTMLGYFMFKLDSAVLISRLMPRFLRGAAEWRGYVYAGVLGIALHVTLDSPIYNDIKPLYPLDYNPTYGLISPYRVYQLCVLSGLLAIVYCIVLMRGAAKSSLRLP